MLNDKELKKLITRDISEAIDEIEKSMPKGRIAINEITVIKSRLKNIEKSQREGIIKNEEYLIERNRITTNLLSFIDEFIKQEKNSNSIIEEVPIVEIEFKFIGGSGHKEITKESPKHNLVHKNRWHYKLSLINNSIYSAYNVKLNFPNQIQELTFEEPLVQNLTLNPFQEIKLEALYTQIRQDFSLINFMAKMKIPPELENLIILLNYENKNGLDVISKFSYKGKKCNNEIVSIK